MGVDPSHPLLSLFLKGECMIDESVVVEWARKTFPESNVISLLRHMAEEFKELVDVAGIDEKREEAKEEIGDLGLMLVHMASFHGTTLAQCMEEKFGSASKRRYAYDPELGYARHVDE